MPTIFSVVVASFQPVFILKLIFIVFSDIMAYRSGANAPEPI